MAFLDAYWAGRAVQHEAEYKLAWMRRYEFLAVKWEAFPSREDLPESERRRLREKYADLYWDAVGVPPDARHELRAALEKLAIEKDRTVEDVIAEIRDRCYSNAQFSPVTPADGASPSLSGGASTAVGFTAGITSSGG
jgi:hypothetical protein